MFSVTGSEYDRFMGRYSVALAPRFAAFAGVEPGTRVLDVGCGTGALTAELVKLTGGERVSGVDPAPQFAEACRVHARGADVRVGPAEALPWGDAEFDRVVAQLVLPFFTDADAAMAEMRRVARPTGVVAVCMWGAGDEMELTDVFWRAASRVDLASHGDKLMRFRSKPEMEALFQRAGFSALASAALDVTATYTGFDDFWQSIEGSAGGVGSYVSKLAPDLLSRLRESCRSELGAPSAPFTLRARGWAVRGTR